MKLLLFVTLLVHCDAFDRMFMSLCKAVFQSIIQTQNHISLRPQTYACNTNISLIIFKGSHIAAEQYMGISKNIQRIGTERGLNIDIKIPYYPCLQDSKQPTYILGHSSGVYDFLNFFNATKYDGLIQVGSVLNSKGRLPWKSRKLQTFPIPVLTLIGKKDGYLRHTYCLDELYNQSEVERYRTKPIIIMKEINHLHIANTSSSAMANIIGLNDLKSNMNVKIAWDMLGVCIVDFIILNMNPVHSVAYNRSLMRMKHIQVQTQQLLSIYSKFDDIHNIKKLVNILQLSINNSTQYLHETTFLNFYNFLISKPSDTHTFCFKSSLLSKMYFRPLWIKMKYTSYISARQINEWLFNKIANNLNIDTRLHVVFQPDNMCFTTMQWICTGMKIKRVNDTIYIQSPVFVTNDKSLIYKNFYYFKILSPSQIIELLNIDLQDF